MCKKDFLRIGFTLTKVLAEDAEYLVKNISRRRIKEDIYCLSLSSNNLMYNSSQGMSATEEDSEVNFYDFTNLGKMMDKYAFSFGDEEKYSYKEKDVELSTQELSYKPKKAIAVFG